MKKFGIFIVLLALAWAIPPARMRLTAFAAPVLHKLGPVGDKLLSPTRRYATQNEVTAIARMIANDQDEGRQLPEERTFNYWLVRRVRSEDGIDVWGNKFWMKRTQKIVTVGSNGPDGERGTKDDVSHTANF